MRNLCFPPAISDKTIRIDTKIFSTRCLVRFSLLGLSSIFCFIYLFIFFQSQLCGNESESNAGLVAADAPKKISGVHKRCWRYIPNLTKSMGSESSMPKPTENTSTDNVQAA